MLVILNWYWECSRLRKAPDIVVFYAPATKNGERALSVTPVHSSVRPSVRPLSKFGVRSITIQFKFGMLIYNIKTQVEFDLGYNPLIFDRVMGIL